MAQVDVVVVYQRGASRFAPSAEQEVAEQWCDRRLTGLAFRKQLRSDRQPVPRDARLRMEGGAGGHDPCPSIAAVPSRRLGSASCGLHYRPRTRPGGVDRIDCMSAATPPEQAIPGAPSTMPRGQRVAPPASLGLPTALARPSVVRIGGCGGARRADHGLRAVAKGQRHARATGAPECRGRLGQSTEARTLARRRRKTPWRDTAARLALAETRVGEVALATLAAWKN